MKKFFIPLFMMLFINNLSYAEITNQKNLFDNSNIVMSIFQKENNNFSEDMPTEIVFRKLNNKNTDQSYILFIKNPYTLRDLYVSIEPIKIKFDDDITKVYYQASTLDHMGNRTRLSIPIKISVINEIKTSTTIQLQIPVYTRDKTQIKYTEYTLPQPVLDEWKQVIAME